MNMKKGVVIPLKDAKRAAAIAVEAERAGWDGFFIGEAIWSIDAWLTLAAAAVQTQCIRLGTMVTPMPLQTPWKLAAESATLDHLSNGRAIVSLGMGAVWMGWQGFPDVPADIHTRAELLDEGIDLLDAFYRGKPFDYAGKHHHLKLTLLDEMHYPPPPVQQPRVPIWVVGVWPRKKSMQRVLKCDGLIPHLMNDEGKFIDVTPAALREMKHYVDANRTAGTPFDFVIEGSTRDEDAAQIDARLAEWQDAGATWWMETLFGMRDDEIAEIVRNGPPRP
jgi:hypothetical protein